MLRIGSRPSPLAVAQARLIAGWMSERLPALEVEIVPIKTTGDKLTSASLARVGGKGLFIRELEDALRARRIDIAVHSMKDLPAVLTKGVRLLAIPRREMVCDVLIGRERVGLALLGRGARVGTASIRRRLQLLRVRDDLEVVALRGNVDSRLARLAHGEFDAVVLAAAGLARLGRGRELACETLNEEDFVPAGGQGALAIEALEDVPPVGREIEQALVALDDPDTRREVSAERALLAAIGASCSSPIGVRARCAPDGFRLWTMLFSLNGSRWMQDRLEGPVPSGEQDSADIGVSLARRLLERGARDLLQNG